MMPFLSSLSASSHCPQNVIVVDTLMRIIVSNDLKVDHSLGFIEIGDLETIEIWRNSSL